MKKKFNWSSLLLIYFVSLGYINISQAIASTVYMIVLRNMFIRRLFHIGLFLWALARVTTTVCRLVVFALIVVLKFIVELLISYTVLSVINMDDCGVCQLLRQIAHLVCPYTQDISKQSKHTLWQHWKHFTEKSTEKSSKQIGHLNRLILVYTSFLMLSLQEN